MGRVWRGMLQVVDSIQKIIALNYGRLCLVTANGDFCAPNEKSLHFLKKGWFTAVYVANRKS
jgi:hypothetical protein